MTTNEQKLTADTLNNITTPTISGNNEYATNVVQNNTTVLDYDIVSRGDHVTRLKPKQRDHPLKFAEFHNQSPLLTMIMTTIGASAAII